MLELLHLTLVQHALHATLQAEVLRLSLERRELAESLVEFRHESFRLLLQVRVALSERMVLRVMFSAGVSVGSCVLLFERLELRLKLHTFLALSGQILLQSPILHRRLVIHGVELSVHLLHLSFPALRLLNLLGRSHLGPRAVILHRHELLERLRQLRLEILNRLLQKLHPNLPLRVLHLELTREHPAQNRLAQHQHRFQVAHASRAHFSDPLRET
mmetsp:Transcript_19991/g.65118  ORF Transcript_19991/g.65118 Transcript_19991/m.65118 type:complete len:216 (+) Transcript_19991:1566-2213(+)